MPIIFNCPACGRELEAPDEGRGSTGACRFCGAEITAPASSEEPAGLIRAGAAPDAGANGAPPMSQPTGYLDAGAVLSEAWGYLKSHWATLLVSYLIVIAIAFAVMAPLFGPLWLKLIRESQPGVQPNIPLVWYLGLLAVGYALTPLGVGPLYVADRIISRGEASIGAVFHGFRHYASILQFSVLIGLPSLMILLLQYAVGTGTSSAMLLGPLVWPVQAFILVTVRPGLMEIVDRGADPMSALKASWEFTKGHRWMILGTWLLLLIAYMAGVLACCVGVFFTMGFIPLGEVLIYRHLRGLQGTPD